MLRTFADTRLSNLNPAKGPIESILRIGQQAGEKGVATARPFKLLIQHTPTLELLTNTPEPSGRYRLGTQEPLPARPLHHALSPSRRQTSPNCAESNHSLSIVIFPSRTVTTMAA